MRSVIRKPLFLFCLAAAGHLAFAQSAPQGKEFTFIKDAGRLPDAAWQSELRERDAWRDFSAAHPGWAVEFNEASGKPVRAYGRPVATNGSTAEQRAMDFITGRLASFGLPIGELAHLSTLPTAKLTYVHYEQRHQGIPVLNSHLMVKLDAQGRVISFGADVHDGIGLDINPVLLPDAAAGMAAQGLGDVTGIEHAGLRILPVPDGRSIDHRLVYELTVLTRGEGLPGQYLSWVDAHTGRLWYRWNQVVDHSACGKDHGHGDGCGQAAGADAQVNGTVLANGPLAASEVRGLPDLRVTVNGNTFYTDQDGALATGTTGPVNALFELRGRWANVVTSNSTPSFSTTLAEGANTVDFDASANVRQLTAYRAVGEVHDHMKTVLPAFTGLDQPLTTNVDLTSGNCNAFYNGTSINFYTQSNGCRSFATLPDVVYHEYGHGINGRYYQGVGSNFRNGAMNEGYADFWAYTITLNPVLALGYQLNNANSYIRRYDLAPKVYPVDLVGAVHADGEIIAGAWWDTYQYIGDLGKTLDLFALAFPGLQANLANGQEGVAFRNVLIDVLQADDDDSDITNGTPNGQAIVRAFARHGITLLSNVTLTHADIETAQPHRDIPVTATVDITFPNTNYLSGVRAFYRLNDETTWNSVLMTNSGGSTYSASFPPQPEGTVIAYYMGVEDIVGQLSSVVPVGAAQQDPNIPYHILVGYELRATSDADARQELGAWATSAPGDNATSGRWEENVPIPSYSGANGTGVMVQPGSQHTPGGDLCWVTQNASGPFAGMGEADVDGGSTTLISSNIDLTGYRKPAFTYWRWYINNPPGGANPNADWWQVYISNNGGSTWVPVEDTKTSDRSWRRMAFRVEDYVLPSSTVRLKFIASDSVRPGQNLDGGSLVEAAVDDIQLWESLVSTVGIDDLPPASITSVYPDPASDELNVLLALNGARGLRMEVVDMVGRTVLVPPAPGGAVPDRHRIDVRRLAEGYYVLRLVWDGGRAERRFSVVR